MVSGGGPVSQWPAVASATGRFILTPAATTVKVFSSVSSALTAVLTGHVADVTAVALAPNTESQVWTASLDGTLRLWDFLEGTELKSYDFGDAIVSLALALQGRRAFVALRWGEGRAGRVAGLDLVTGRMLPGKLATHNPGAVVVSGKGNYVATVDRHSLHVWSAERPEQRIVLHTTKRLTCVALDANEKRVAAGDASGRISVWHGFAPAVAAAFPEDAAAPMEGIEAGPAPQGVYLLSGGQEAVLVAWQLDTGKRTYLPRLAGPLTAISPVARDAARYVLTQADNTLRLVNLATMRVECSVHGLRPEPRLAPGQPRAGPAAAAIAPGSGALVVAGSNALLQFYDALRDRHIDKLQVAPRNAVSLTEQDAAAFGGLYGPPPAPCVSHAAFSGDGAALATVDVRADAGAAGSAAPVLQFWDARSGGGGGFALNTQIAEPHRRSVTGLAYHPGEDLAVTTSDDGTFRVWARVAAPPRTRAAVAGAAAAAPAAKGHWLCRSVGSYRDAPMTAAAFSADGSLVAVAAGDTVTLWDPAANALVAVLPPPAAHPPGSPFTRLAFVPGTPYLAGAAGPPNPGSYRKGAGVGGAVLLFDAASAAPKAAWALPGARASALLFAPPGTPLASAGSGLGPAGASALLILTADRRFTLARVPGAPAEAAAPAAGIESAREQGVLGYEAAFGKAQGGGKAGGGADAEAAALAATSEAAAAAAGSWQSLFDAPSHVLPPLSVLCPAFLEVMVGAQAPADA
ncbi:hypothetical protein WJX81_007552 [Elliptochloris bilobata]|uniref:WD repeat-containing protein 75 second beta-propeller domain-containing protein n=1 Tax=Elliptochloris bilobata TaxID=381761 RepID=A0AAW1R0V6_9CHLO